MSTTAARPDLDRRVSFMNQLDTEEQVEKAIRKAIDGNDLDEIPSLLEKLETFSMATTIVQMRYVDNPICKLFAYAIVNGASPEILEKFIEKNPPLQDNIAAFNPDAAKDMMVDRDTGKFYFGTPMQLAALAGNLEAAFYFLGKGVPSDSVNKEASEGCLKERPIDLACLKGNEVIGAFLLECNTKNADGNPPLHAICAVKRNSNVEKSVRMLLEHGADVTATNSSGQTALQVLEAHSNDKGAKQLLVQKHFCQAIEDLNLEELKEAEVKGANIEQGNFPSITPLQELCGKMGGAQKIEDAIQISKRILPLIHVLLDSDADKEAPIKVGRYDGKTPLQVLEDKVNRKIKFLTGHKTQDPQVLDLIDVLNQGVVALGGKAIKLELEPIEKNVHASIFVEKKEVKPISEKKVTPIRPTPKASTSSCWYVALAGAAAVVAYFQFQQ